MKLSEKGLGKLYNSKACYYDNETEEEVVALSYFEHVFEFEPDDFRDAVILSVEEAQAVLNTYAQVHSKLNAYGKAFYESLKSQIEQAEKQK